MSAAAASSSVAGPPAPASCPLSADSLSFLSDYARTQRFKIGTPSNFSIAPRGDKVYFLRTESADAVTQNLYEVDVASGQESVLVRADDLVPLVDVSMSEEERKLRERKRLTSKGILSFQPLQNSAALIIPYQTNLYLCDTSAPAGSPNRITNLTKDSPFENMGSPSYPQVSPDGTKVAFIRAGDIFVVEFVRSPAAASAAAAASSSSAPSGAFQIDEYRLTFTGSAQITNGVAEFVAQEELDRFRGMWWSPSSDRLLFQNTDTTALEHLNILDLQNPAEAPSTAPYPRPGKANAIVKLGILKVQKPLQTFSLSDSAPSGPISSAAAVAATATEDQPMASADEKAAKKRKREDESAASSDASAAAAPSPTTPLAEPLPSSVWLDWDNVSLPYLCTVTWGSSGPLTLVVQNRLQNLSVMLTVEDLSTGACREVLQERDETEGGGWVSVDRSMPYWFGAWTCFLWSSEAPSGYSTLYLHDRSGQRLRAIHHPEQVMYRKLLKVDEAAGRAYILAGTNATEQHVVCVELGDIGGGGGAGAGAAAAGVDNVTSITTTPALHFAEFAAAAPIYVHESHSLEHGSKFVVRRLPEAVASGAKPSSSSAAGSEASAGQVLCEIKSVAPQIPERHLPRVQLLQVQANERLAWEELQRSNALIAEDAKSNPLTLALKSIVPRRTSLLDYSASASASAATPAPESFATHTYNVAILRPRGAKVTEVYPVVCYCYGGPGHRLVTQDRGTYLIAQFVADCGYIVVVTDNRGTPFRGRAWEKAIAGNYHEKPLADQVAVIRTLAASDPSMDLSKGVGMYGWSFGGYLSALAAMRYPSLFAATFVGAPVCDWRDYDTVYTERVLGLPLEREADYDASSVLTYAHQLLRPLLLVHGSADDNVYFCHALKMSAEMFKHGREHVFLPLGGTHMLADPMVTVNMYTRLCLFLLRHIPSKPVQ